MKPKNLFPTLAGFTLIELLVVIAIVSVLASAIIVAINPAERIKEARDAQRKNDIGQIANALQAYYATYSEFPLETKCDSSKGAYGGAPPLCNYSSQNPPAGTDWSTISGIYQLVPQGFIKKLPIDPKNTGDFASDNSYYYRYEPVPASLVYQDGTEQCNNSGSPCAYYYIAAHLEAKNGAFTWRCGDRSNMTNPPGCREVSYTDVHN